LSVTSFCFHQIEADKAAKLAKEKAAAERAASNEAKPSSSTSDEAKKDFNNYKEISGFGWDQSTKSVTIYFSDLHGVGELPKENVTCIFKERSFDIKIMGLKGNLLLLHSTDSQ
jgi:calcyclin binding protein